MSAIEGGRIREFAPDTDGDFFKRFDDSGVIADNLECIFDFGLVHTDPDGKPAMAGLVMQSAIVVLFADLPKRRLNKRDLFGFSAFLEAVAREMNRRGPQPRRSLTSCAGPAR
jgi:hypothetical protein